MSIARGDEASFASLYLGAVDDWRVSPSTCTAVLRGRHARLSELVGPDTRSVIVVSGVLTIDEPAPQVTLLVAKGDGLVGSLDRLPSLQGLVYDGYEPLNSPPGSLTQVICREPSLRSLVGLDLTALRVSGSVVRAEQLVFPNLRWLHYTPSSGVSKAMRPLERLERLWLEFGACSLASVARLGPKPMLEHCVLEWGGLRALDGIERWERLRELTLHATGVPTLDPLAESGVERLQVQSAGRAVDVRALVGWRSCARWSLMAPS